MDTTERMMIMGMCLQGLLANAHFDPLDSRFFHDNGPDEKATVRFTDKSDHVAELIRLAHQIADRLDPPPEATDAERIARLTRISYEAVRAATTLGWVSYDDARTSQSEVDLGRLDDVFDRVSRWFHDPVGVAEGFEDRIIAAVVAAGRD